MTKIKKQNKLKLYKSVTKINKNDKHNKMTLTKINLKTKKYIKIKTNSKY